MVVSDSTQSHLNFHPSVGILLLVHFLVVRCSSPSSFRHQLKSSIQTDRGPFPVLFTTLHQMIPTFVLKTIACWVITVVDLFDIRAFHRLFKLTGTFQFSLRDVSWEMRQS
jgi:hypothetical protein